MDLVAAEFGVTKEQLLGRDRHKNLADAKQAMVMVARDTGWTVMGLGSKIGRHYTAVVKSRQFASNKYQTEPKFRLKVDHIKSAL